MKVVVLSDTHIRRGGTRRLPDEIYEALGAADAVLHAGDVVVGEVLDELSGFAPTYAVLGNNDEPALTNRLPESRTVELAGVRIGLVHDSGDSRGRAGRVRRRFANEDVVVYGHSHIPFCGEGVGGQLLFNPGSPTERRGQPYPSFGLLELDEGRVATARIVHITADRGG